jgi:hypothetical protein
VLPGDQAVDTPTLPYLGVGYTGLSPRGGWSFNADLGLMSLNPGNAGKLGRVFGGGQSLDDTVRDMRWSPVVQLGVSTRSDVAGPRAFRTPEGSAAFAV